MRSDQPAPNEAGYPKYPEEEGAGAVDAREAREASAPRASGRSIEALSDDALASFQGGMKRRPGSRRGMQTKTSTTNGAITKAASQMGPAHATNAYHIGQQQVHGRLRDTTGDDVEDAVLAAVGNLAALITLMVAEYTSPG